MSESSKGRGVFKRGVWREDNPAFVEFNQAASSDAVGRLLGFCGSGRWAEILIAHHPYSSVNSLLVAAEEVWFSLAEPDWLEAFAAHPRIGEKKAPTTAYLASSENEQSAVRQTLEPVAEALLKGNHAYEEKFGFRYIVFASGRTAPELLAILEERLTHTRERELHEAAHQQYLITTLRMTKWLQQEES